MSSAASLSISTVPTTDHALRSKVRSLEAANDTVLAVFNRAFFLHAAIMNPRGTQLQAVMMTLRTLLTDRNTGRIAQYRAICANGALSERSRTVDEEQLETIERVFGRLCDNAPNDDASRTQKLTVFFAALVLEHALFERLLPNVEQAVRHFAPDDSVVTPVDAASERLSATFLARRALTAFATKYLRQYFSRLIDGANDVLESSDTFAEDCVNAYMSQLPPYMPIEMAALLGERQ